MSFLASAFLTLFSVANANPDGRTETTVPNSVQKSLMAIDRPLGFAAECIELHSEFGLDTEFEKLEKQYLDAIAEAQGVWPDAGDTNELVLASLNAGPPWPNCRRAKVQAALKEGRNALSAYGRLFRQHTAKMDLPGAWVGPIQLCRENVIGTEIISNSLTNEPALSVKLAPALRDILLKVTKTSVGRQLAIRLDGKVIVKPNVHEPIEKGEFQISSSDRMTLGRVAERAAAPC